MRDVLIAGGGPAGLAAAIFGAQAGMRVVIVEPHVGAIDKACGEGIMPAGRALLERMGVTLSQGREFSGIRYHCKGSTATGRFRNGAGLGVRRVHLSDAMWRRALDLGVERVQGRIRNVEALDRGVRAAGIEAKWLVAADGLHSEVRSSLGIPLSGERRGRFGMRRHFRVEDDSEFVDVYLGHSDEAYVTPVSDGVVGVALLSSIPKRLDDGLDQFRTLRERLLEPVSAEQGAGPFNRFAARVASDRVALVGDAAGFLDPITGEGIRLGFESARLAIDCMLGGSLSQYETGWRRIVRRYRWITGSLLTIRRTPLLNPAIVPVLKAFPFVFDSMLTLLAGESKVTEGLPTGIGRVRRILKDVDAS